MASKNYVCLSSACPEVSAESCFFDPILFEVIRVFFSQFSVVDSFPSLVFNLLCHTAVHTSCCHLILTLAHSAWLKSDLTKITSFQGSGAFASTHKILTLLCRWEQAIQKMQEQLQRVSAGHKAMHQELSALRCMVDTRSRVRLVEPKNLMPDWFGMKNGPSWMTWSYPARDFVGVVHAALKQAMKSAENLKQPISVTHLPHEFKCDERDGSRVATLLHLKDEALEVFRGAERERGLEQWR